jgi:hypothetical protein
MHRTCATPFVSTRWAGSKRRFLGGLERVLAGLAFERAVDVFSGSGAVSHLLKRMGKVVHANDALASCHESALALVVNGRTRLGDAEARRIFERHPERSYPALVARTWPGIYYLEAEDLELDVAIGNVRAIEGRLERALAWHALFQACLKKRPYALFHRANLSLRTADVARSFGNKRTWDTPFAVHFERALVEAHAALVDDGRPHLATCLDALDCPLDADLVYLDPPYVRADGRGFDYADAYHLLEALLDEGLDAARVDPTRRHRPYQLEARTDFARAPAATEALRALIRRAPRRAIVVVSYRSDGLPSPEELVAWLDATGRRVRVERLDGRPYALSTRGSSELVFVAEPAA